MTDTITQPSADHERYRKERQERLRFDMNAYWSRLDDEQKTLAAQATKEKSLEGLDEYDLEEALLAKEIFVLPEPAPVERSGPPRCFCGTFLSVPHDHAGFPKR